MGLAIDDWPGNVKAGCFDRMLGLADKFLNDIFQGAIIRAVEFGLGDGFARSGFWSVEREQGFGATNIAGDQHPRVPLSPTA